MSFPAAPWARRRDGRKADTTIEKQNNDRAPRRSAAPRPEGSGFGAPLSEEELRQARRAQGAKGPARGGNGGKRRKRRRKSRARGLLVTLLVLRSVWNGGRGNRYIIAALVLSIIATVYLTFLSRNLWQLFILAIPCLLLVFLCARISKKR